MNACIKFVAFILVLMGFVLKTIESSDRETEIVFLESDLQLKSDEIIDLKGIIAEKDHQIWKLVGEKSEEEKQIWWNQRIPVNISNLSHDTIRACIASPDPEAAMRAELQAKKEADRKIMAASFIDSSLGGNSKNQEWIDKKVREETVKSVEFEELEK